MLKACISLIWIPALLMGCSRTYINTPFEKLEYFLDEAAPGIEFGYQLDALSRSGNRRFERLARGQGFEILAVKVVNRTERPFPIRAGLELTAEGIRLDVVPADTIVSWVQHRGGGLPYLGPADGTTLIPWMVSHQVSKRRAVSANRAFVKELTGCDLYDVTLKPQEQVIGCLLLRGVIKQNLLVRTRVYGAPK